MGQCKRYINNAANHDANGAKFKDWYLPTKRELSFMYSNRVSIGGFTHGRYWSYTKNKIIIAWIKFFSNGFQTNYYKDLTDNVRAVRAF